MLFFLLMFRCSIFCPNSTTTVEDAPSSIEPVRSFSSFKDEAVYIKVEGGGEGGANCVKHEGDPCGWGS